jgi:hypothetical protein
LLFACTVAARERNHADPQVPAYDAGTQCILTQFLCTSSTFSLEISGLLKVLKPNFNLA